MVKRMTRRLLNCRKRIGIKATADIPQTLWAKKMICTPLVVLYFAFLDSPKVLNLLQAIHLSVMYRVHVY